MNPALSLDQELARRLEDLSRQGLQRALRRVDSAQSPHLTLDGVGLLNFSSNDYLGLANDPRLKEAAVRAIERYGAGSGASRLICGSLAPHAELDDALAAFKGTEAALSFTTGYAAALGTLGALLGKDDVVLVDRLVHACIIDATRLSGARLRVFAHNDLADLERALKRLHSSGRPQRPPVLIVTESVFSMDGDRAPLRELVALKERHGAWLMVDEAHATGLYGPHRRGLAEELGVSPYIEIQMGTLGKALGASGGFIAGSRTLIDFLINRARSFIFSTAPVPAASGAAVAALEFVQSPLGAQRRDQLWQRVAAVDVPGAFSCSPGALGSSAVAADLPGSALPSVILPLVLGAEAKAVEVAARLQAQGLFIPAIRYPSVARGKARLRLTVTAAHSPADIATLNAALQSLAANLAQPSP